MNRIKRVTSIFIMFMMVIWGLTQMACGPEPDSHKPQEESKKSHLKEKQVPVFQVQAIITMVDGTVYEVDKFAFYSKHRRFSGTFYRPRSGNTDIPFFLNQGPLWKKIDLSKVGSIKVSYTNKGPHRWAIDMTMLDGSKLNGGFADGAYETMWFPHGQVFVTGPSGREFKCQFNKIAGFERLGQEKQDIPLIFKISYLGKGKRPSIIRNPKFKLIWKEQVPVYLDKYTFQSEMPVKTNNTEIKIKPGEIATVTVPSQIHLPFKVTMKKGEALEVKLPPRVYGELKNGDIVFTPMIYKNKPLVKEIRFQ